MATLVENCFAGAIFFEFLHCIYIAKPRVFGLPFHVNRIIVCLVCRNYITTWCTDGQTAKLQLSHSKNIHFYMTNHHSEQLTIWICGYFLLNRNIYCNYYKFTIIVCCWNVCFLFTVWRKNI